jgi:hypothetical protein
MQLAAVIVIVSLAAGYVVWSAWRAFAGKKLGCGTGCGKCTAPASPELRGRISLPQL